MGLVQYIKDTRGELRHVAWPTRTQTLVYTLLVIGISLLVSVYLGFFDFLFTRGLGRFVEVVPSPHLIDTVPVSSGNAHGTPILDIDSTSAQ